LAGEIEALGPVEHIVAPNRLHHSYLSDAIERYPKAKVWAAPRLADKRKDVRFDATLGDEDPPWAATVDTLHLRGNPWIEEVVFLHRPSQTLIVTDLVFNITEVANVWTRLLLGSAGAYGRLSQSMAWRFTTRDKEALGRSLDTMFEWNFERVVMAHGAIIDRGGKAALASMVRWARGDRALAAANAA
jgi:hypothetical protein